MNRLTIQTRISGGDGSIVLGLETERLFETHLLGEVLDLIHRLACKLTEGRSETHRWAILVLLDGEEALARIDVDGGSMRDITLAMESRLQGECDFLAHVGHELINFAKGHERIVTGRNTLPRKVDKIDAEL